MTTEQKLRVDAAYDAAIEELQEFRGQEDYLLAHGASLMSDDSHEIIHKDTLRRVVEAVLRATTSDKGAPKPPRWYTRNEIVHTLKLMKYHETIAQELADWIVRHLQGAFNKGFQKGTLANNLCSDHYDKQIGKSCLVCEIERLQRKLAIIQPVSAAQQVDGGEVFDALKAQKDAIEERNFERDLSERLSPIAFDAMRICLGKEPKTFSAKQVVAYITEVAGATPPAATDGFVIVPRDKLEHLLEYWNGNVNERAMEDALNFILDELGALAAAPQSVKEDGWLPIDKPPIGALQVAGPLKWRHGMKENDPFEIEPPKAIYFQDARGKWFVHRLARLPATPSPPSKAEGE